MDNMTTIKIETYDELLATTGVFDDAYYTTTHILSMSLRDIWDHFWFKNMPGMRYDATTPAGYVHRMTHSYITALFADTNIRYSNEEGTSIEHIGKLHSIYKIREDIVNGKSLYAPMCVSRFTPTQHGIHPGFTRQAFTEYYAGKVDVMLTDYSGTVKLDPTLLAFKVDELQFPLDEVPLNYISLPSDSLLYGTETYHNVLNYNRVFIGGRDPVVAKTIQQLTNVYTDDMGQYYFPRKMADVATFELRNDDKLYINDALVMIKHDRQWAINLDKVS